MDQLSRRKGLNNCQQGGHGGENKKDRRSPLIKQASLTDQTFVMASTFGQTRTISTRPSSFEHLLAVQGRESAAQKVVRAVHFTAPKVFRRTDYSMQFSPLLRSGQYQYIVATDEPFSSSVFSTIH
ncbi:unnamed protein product [Protopolystoma xenopodis]|uniref:Uncharacterized protein n=1 Tax=Protopolystoma xenopodis TaxID=117903 RepID=A0A3S4ZTX1_9PLAT|nr:unnamed protein product [Protopolystoma xenopodis]